MQRFLLNLYHILLVKNVKIQILEPCLVEAEQQW